MDKRILKGWLNHVDNGKDLPDWQKKILIDLWDVILYWGACGGNYYSVRSLANGFGVNTKTIYAKVRKFKKIFPEAHKKLKEDRERAKRVHKRQANSFRSPVSWDGLKEEFGDEPEYWIVEKF